MIPKQTEFTRRIPVLTRKQESIDAKVARRLVHAWDVLHDAERVREVFFKDAHRLSDPRYVDAGSSRKADCPETTDGMGQEPSAQRYSEMEEGESATRRWGYSR